MSSGQRQPPCQPYPQLVRIIGPISCQPTNRWTCTRYIPVCGGGRAWVATCSVERFKLGPLSNWAIAQGRIRREELVETYEKPLPWVGSLKGDRLVACDMLQSWPSTSGQSPYFGRHYDPPCEKGFVKAEHSDNAVILPTRLQTVPPTDVGKTRVASRLSACATRRVLGPPSKPSSSILPS